MLVTLVGLRKGKSAQSEATASHLKRATSYCIRPNKDACPAGVRIKSKDLRVAEMP